MAETYDDGRTAGFGGKLSRNVIKTKRKTACTTDDVSQLAAVRGSAAFLRPSSAPRAAHARAMTCVGSGVSVARVRVNRIAAQHTDKGHNTVLSTGPDNLVPWYGLL